MLTAHLLRVINQEPRLLRILDVDQVTDTTDWSAVAKAVDEEGVSSRERALALCLCELAGVTTGESFGYWFDRLDSEDMHTIATFLDRYASTAQAAEQPTRPLFEV